MKDVNPQERLADVLGRPPGTPFCRLPVRLHLSWTAQQMVHASRRSHVDPQAKVSCGVGGRLSIRGTRITGATRYAYRGALALGTAQDCSWLRFGSRADEAQPGTPVPGRPRDGMWSRGRLVHLFTCQRAVDLAPCALFLRHWGKGWSGKCVGLWIRPSESWPAADRGLGHAR
jgi:hypothetical protein